MTSLERGLTIERTRRWLLGQVAALAGVAPHCQHSGSLKGKRSFRGGRATVPGVLYLATLYSTIHNLTIREHSRQLLSRGKAKKVALLACARKLLT